VKSAILDRENGRPVGGQAGNESGRNGTNSSRI
jgi:hypothetical protein